MTDKYTAEIYDDELNEQVDLNEPVSEVEKPASKSKSKKKKEKEAVEVEVILVTNSNITYRSPSGVPIRIKRTEEHKDLKSGDKIFV